MMGRPSAEAFDFLKFVDRDWVAKCVGAGAKSS